MFDFKKHAKIVFIILVLVLLLSTSVSASGYDIKYVYYEWGTNEDIYMVNYEDAFSDQWPYKTSLYDRMVSGIEFALTRFKDVYVEVLVTGETSTIIIDYSEAVKESTSLTDAVNDVIENGSASDFHAEKPTPKYELYLDRFGQVATRTPQPFELPAWVEKITVFKPEDFSEKWVVDVEIDEAELPGDANLNDITAVRILGRDAVAEKNDDNTNTGFWRILIDADQKPTVEPGQVRIRIDGTWHD